MVLVQKKRCTVVKKKIHVLYILLFRQKKYLQYKYELLILQSIVQMKKNYYIEKYC